MSRGHRPGERAAGEDHLVVRMRVEGDEGCHRYSLFPGEASRVGWSCPRSVTVSPKDQRALSLSLAPWTVSAVANNPPGCDLASSHSRAAALTGSPITVYSNRSLAPTLPATTWPAATPIP